MRKAKPVMKPKPSWKAIAMGRFRCEFGISSAMCLPNGSACTLTGTYRLTYDVASGVPMAYAPFSIPVTKMKPFGYQPKPSADHSVQTVALEACCWGVAAL